MIDARSDSFPLVSGALNPCAPFATRKPCTPSSVFAQTSATSATLPLVIHIFAPFTTQSPPFLTARVSMAPGSEPWSGSVRPKQPIALPFASAGSQRCFCASDP